MNLLTIDESKCTKCGICIESCPIMIIETKRDSQFPFVKGTKAGRCLYCGHCESVCPDDALTHQLAEDALSPKVEGSAEINPIELGKYFRNRRSIRNYLSKPVDRNVLEEIMDVVRYSPTATNNQLNQWVIISDHDIIRQLASGTVNWMKMVADAKPDVAGMYNLHIIIGAYEQGIDSICRDAPHIFLCYSASNYLPGPNDAFIATSQLELLLPSYGLGSCWAGFLMMALQNSTELKKIVGLDESFKVHTALMAGYSKYKYYLTPPRKKTAIKWM